MKKIFLILVLIIFNNLLYGELTVKDINGVKVVYNDIIEYDIQSITIQAMSSQDKQIMLVPITHINKLFSSYNNSHFIAYSKVLINIFTDKKTDLEVKRRYYGNDVKFIDYEPTEFDNNGNATKFCYKYEIDLGGELQAIMSFISEDVELIINDKRHIINNIYKDNKEFKKRLVELVIENAKKLNPNLSLEEIEDVLGIKYIKKYL